MITTYYKPETTYTESPRLFRTKEGEPVYSKGEQEIADFLHDHNIDYFYEKSVHLGRRKWVPDFYLPAFKTYIEYQGMNHDQKAHKRYAVKYIEFKIHNIDVIYLYPSDCGRLGEILLNKLENLRREY